MTISLWMDERLRAVDTPFRKIHLDYHNSQHIPRIGQNFDADEFGETLLAGHVDSIVVFAKDMHGYSYYPSATAPVHPALTFDMLAGQVAACRARGIKVYAYYCVTWDNLLAEQRPEWLVWKRDRTTYLPKFDEPPAWTALCLSNEAFVAQVLEHSREILQNYEIDGIWYDMPLPIGGECFCATCLATLRGRGLDPLDTGVQRRHKQELLVDFMRRCYELAQQIRPGCQVDQNNQTRLGLGARAPFMGNIDIEALPTAFWGYLYYPTMVRYSRNFGVAVCGMSGRFQSHWADFGGLKHPNQLLAEMPGILAHAAQADLGDQLPPNGRLDPAVYQTIGIAYAEVKRLEPWLRGAVPVTEAAILVSGDPLDDIGTAHAALTAPNGPAVFGLTKLLMELHIQFDIVEPDQAFERYRLLVLPDELIVDEALAERLRAYMASGGAIIGSHTAMRLAGGDALWAGLGATYAGESPFTPAYLKLGADTLWDGLPDYEYALYEGTARWQPAGEGSALANVGVPLFQRSGAHYTSHMQTPVDHITDDVAVAAGDRVAGAAFPIGRSYFQHGYWIYREVFARLLHRLLPEPLVETNAPLSAEVTVTHQAKTADHGERWLVHIVNFSPNRRAPGHPDFLEDPIPLRDVRLLLRAPASFASAHLAGSGAALPLTGGEGAWETVVPEVRFGAIAVFETAGEPAN